MHIQLDLCDTFVKVCSGTYPILDPAAHHMNILDGRNSGTGIDNFVQFSFVPSIAR